MNSINAFDDSTCVDIFVRPDGSFGFEEYRHDFEDGRGWFPIGHYSSQSFGTEEAARKQAVKCIAWLSE
jgi:hypothetical protein